MENIKVYTAIIGGGASGLMCGCVASKNAGNKKVVIIEKADRVGKKILVSGNGRCNLSNLKADLSNYHGGFYDGVKFLLENYSPKKVIEYFESIGLMCKADDDGRVYPLCRQSSAVLAVLRNELKRNNADEIVNTTVNSISKTNDGFELRCDKLIIHAKKVVIATGGHNDHAQRVVESSHKLAQMMNHSVTELSPSLCPIKVKSDYIKSLKGIRAKAKVTAVINDKEVKSEYGEVQFSSDALSGICVFNLSSIVSKADNAKIRLQLLPDYSFEEIKGIILKRIRLVKNECVQEIFTGLFHKNIGLAILKGSKTDTSKKANKLSSDEIDRLCRVIDKWDFDVKKSEDFSSAQVTKGGVNASEINPNTLESRKVKGLYFCGEGIDVDGDCGGFNLQFAFSSGMCVGEQIAK